MSLSPPADRRPIHTRRVVCQGFRRNDGLWDIEGHLIDTKAYDFANRDRGGVIAAGEPIHEMVVRLTIDDAYIIRKAEAVTLHAPFSICGAVAPAFSSLEGVCLGPGFLRTVRERFGKTAGCTHLVELMGPLATTAFQTLAPLIGAEAGNGARPRIIDSCHALAADGEVVAREWPQFSTRRATDPLGDA
ncbi:DUF2889 domain-containing protein [Telmatospirillum siberiense]|uniref:DUF2889 domain-containing protein n=1 Tax=Telmatospirillum siberiense TaxID=382514 RepID=A0A2N3PQW3_9PROT|nr:DUF2889 domain-containing protein [Telmatospirillum siberiense]PKU22772.1 hypothetical protein CWS72_20075 [Telmatospirillum siberiense]